MIIAFAVLGLCSNYYLLHGASYCWQHYLKTAIQSLPSDTKLLSIKQTGHCTCKCSHSSIIPGYYADQATSEQKPVRSTIQVPVCIEASRQRKEERAVTCSGAREKREEKKEEERDGGTGGRQGEREWSA